MQKRFGPWRGVIALRQTQILIIMDSPVFNTVRRYKNLKGSSLISPTPSTEPRKCSGETSIRAMIDIGQLPPMSIIFPFLVSAKRGKMMDIGGNWPMSIIAQMVVSPLHFLASVESVGLIDEEPYKFLNRRTGLNTGESIIVNYCFGSSAITPLQGSNLFWTETPNWHHGFTWVPVKPDEIRAVKPDEIRSGVAW
jgi:hypothetical protein